MLGLNFLQNFLIDFWVFLEILEILPRNFEGSIEAPVEITYICIYKGGNGRRTPSHPPGRPAGILLFVI